MNAGMGVFLGYEFTELRASGDSDLEAILSAMATVILFVVSYGLWNLHLELRINKTQISARAWPFQRTKISIDQVLTSETVKIDPFQDYNGWGIKGTRQDRLIGGGGTTALRITYNHESGEERKLTFLTDRAEEAAALITDLRSR